MEQLILSHKNPEISNALNNIYYLIKKFKDIWFPRDAKVTVDNLIQFDIEFCNIINFLFPQNSDKNGKDNKLIHALNAFYLLHHVDEKQFNKIFRIPIKINDSDKKELQTQRLAAFNSWKYLYTKIGVDN